VRKQDRSKALRERKVEGLVRSALQENNIGAEACDLGEELRPGHGGEIPTPERLDILIDGLLVSFGRPLEGEGDLMASRHECSQQPGQVGFSSTDYRLVGSRDRDPHSATLTRGARHR
jgi:hypothetical protein